MLGKEFETSVLYNIKECNIFQRNVNDRNAHKIVDGWMLERKQNIQRNK